MTLFTDVLRQFRNGRLVDEATRQFNELVRAVDDTGKTGSLTLTVTIKPEKGGGNQKALIAQVKTKTPQSELPEAVFFSDEDGNLHRDDPKQQEMFAEANANRIGRA